MKNSTGTYCWLNALMHVITKIVKSLNLQAHSDMEKYILAVSVKRTVIDNRRLGMRFRERYRPNEQHDSGDFFLNTFVPECPNFSRLFTYTLSKTFTCSHPMCNAHINTTVEDHTTTFLTTYDLDIDEHNILALRSIIDKVNRILDGFSDDPGTGCATHPTANRTVHSELHGRQPPYFFIQLILPNRARWANEVKVRLPTDTFAVSNYEYSVDSIIQWQGHISKEGIAGHYTSYLNFTREHGVWISASDIHIDVCIDERSSYVSPYIIVLKQVV